MAKDIIVRGAQPNTKDQKIDTVYIEITGHFPYSIKAEELEKTREGFKEDAQKLFDALRSLPGGTFDQLLILMLRKTASSFVVPHDFHDEQNNAVVVGELAQACQRLREIIRDEFSWDGRDWNGLKRYQHDVDQALVAIRNVRGEKVEGKEAKDA